MNKHSHATDPVTTLAIRIIDFIFVECMCNIIHWIIYVPLCKHSLFSCRAFNFALPLFNVCSKYFFLFHLMLTLCNECVKFRSFFHIYLFVFVVRLQSIVTLKIRSRTLANRSQAFESEIILNMQANSIFRFICLSVAHPPTSISVENQKSSLLHLQGIHMKQ